MASDIFVIIENDLELEKGRILFVKTKRYRRGVVPDWTVKLGQKYDTVSDEVNTKIFRTLKLSFPFLTI